jgi:hypothetical protein
MSILTGNTGSVSYHERALTDEGATVGHPLSQALPVLTFTAGAIDAESYPGVGRVFKATIDRGRRTKRHADVTADGGEFMNSALRLTSPLKRLSTRVRGGEETEFVLQIVRPSLVGMIDGTVSTLAPIFAAAVSSNSRTALLVGLPTALGARVGMGISEAPSDTGQATGRGSAGVRGAITGAANDGRRGRPLPPVHHRQREPRAASGGRRRRDLTVRHCLGAVEVLEGHAPLVTARGHPRRGDRACDWERVTGPKHRAGLLKHG